MTLEEFKKLVGSIDTRTNKGVRDQAILLLVYYCAFRISELTDITPAHIGKIAVPTATTNFEFKLCICGKNSAYMMNRKVQFWLSNYIRRLELHGENRNCILFRSINKRSDRFTKNAFLPRNARDMLKLRCERAGIRRISFREIKEQRLIDLASAGVSNEEIACTCGYSSARAVVSALKRHGLSSKVHPTVKFYTPWFFSICHPYNQNFEHRIKFQHRIKIDPDTRTVRLPMLRMMRFTPSRPWRLGLSKYNLTI